LRAGDAEIDHRLGEICHQDAPVKIQGAGVRLSMPSCRGRQWIQAT
jgi:hypothetical protein